MTEPSTIVINSERALHWFHSIKSMNYNFFEIQESTPEASESLFEIAAEEDRKKFICKYTGCGKFFRYKSEIIRHIATHSESRPFICHYDNCFKSFKRNDALENHIRSSHTKETPFACPFPDCGMKFTTHGSFRYHVLKHNKQLPDGEDFGQNPEQLFDISQQRKQIKLDSPVDDFVSFDQEPLKMSSKKFVGIDEDNEFFVPPPRIAGKIQWEMVSDETEIPVQAPQKTEEPKEDKLQFILEENKQLKQKLFTSEKMIKSMQVQIDDLLFSLFERRQSQPGDMPNIAMQSFQRNNSLQSVFMDTNAKLEEPYFDMITYDENNGSNEHVGPIYSNQNNNADMFLSFDREIENFDF
jgi:hypothetical protein